LISIDVFQVFSEIFFFHVYFCKSNEIVRNKFFGIRFSLAYLGASMLKSYADRLLGVTLTTRSASEKNK